MKRIHRYDSDFGICNFVADPDALFDQAVEAAARWRQGAPLSPLDGVPFGVKANIAVRGFPWHGGIAAFRNRRASADADCVRPLRAAGMIPMAVFNMHEAALGGTTGNPAFRTTRNPHDLGRIPGGSSGGSAAAVAAGFAPIALGTDSLGSVRLPSALCGVVGFKPGRGLIPLGGVMPLCDRLDHVGLHGRSVADVEAVTLLFRPQGWRRESSGDPRPDEPDLGGGGLRGGAESEAGHPAEPVKLARWDVAHAEPEAPEVGVAFARILSDHGVDGHSDWTDADLSAIRRAGLLVCERAAAREYAGGLRDDAEGFSAMFRRLVAWGAAQPEQKVRGAEGLLADSARRLRADLDDQLLLSPTTAHGAPRIGAPIPVTLADLTAPAAIAGVPAVSVPMRPPSDGLPVGLQVMGLDDAGVLAAARKLFPGIAARVP